MGLTVNGSLNLTALLTGASPDVATPQQQLVLSRLINLASGVGAGQADRMYAKTRQIAASANDDLDLAGVLVDPTTSAAITFARVKGLYVAADPANTNNVVVGAAAAAQWNTLLNATGTVTLRPGEFMLVACGAADATGHVVTATTADILRVANSGAGTSVNYDIAIWGTSA